MLLFVSTPSPYKPPPIACSCFPDPYPSFTHQAYSVLSHSLLLNIVKNVISGRNSRKWLRRFYPGPFTPTKQYRFPEDHDPTCVAITSISTTSSQSIWLRQGEVYRERREDDWNVERYQ